MYSKVKVKEKIYYDIALGGSVTALKDYPIYWNKHKLVYPLHFMWGGKDRGRFELGT